MAQTGKNNCSENALFEEGCPYCGASVDLTSRRCTYCGTAFLFERPLNMERVYE